MTLRWLEGFDNYGTTGMTGEALETAIQLRCPNSVIYHTAEQPEDEFSILSAGYGDGLGLQLGQSNQLLYLCVDVATSTEWSVGCAIKITGAISQYAESAGTNVIGYMSTIGGSPENYLQVSPAGVVSAWQGSGNLLGYANQILLPNTWYYLEYSLSCSTVDGEGSVEIRINGTSVLIAPGTGAGTVMTNDPIIAINFSGVKTEDGLRHGILDDIYIADGLVFLGPLKVSTLRPASDTTTIDWIPSTGTTHYNLLNETPANTATYVSSNTANASDLYAIDTLDASVVGIQGIQIEGLVNLDANGSESLRIQCDSNGSQVDETFTVTDIDPIAYSIVLENDPDTSALWLPSAIDLLQVGIKYGS
jgi:hypothetical protein